MSDRLGTIMTDFYNKIKEIYHQAQKKVDIKRWQEKREKITAIVLGSGLGEFAENVQDAQILNYSEIEGFPVATNKSHKGRFVIGFINKKPVIVMEGRIHYYEGYTMKEVVTPICFMKMAGAERIILTNAAGGISNDLEVGSLMMLTDHISSFVPSPLIGENDENLGTRFPDMTHVYDLDFQERIRSTAVREKINLKEGVYLQTTGPNYETPAEIKMYKTLGADAVGMSTVCEAMMANYMQMKVCGISCITNKAAGIEDKQLNDEEVKEAAGKASHDFKKLLMGII